MRQTVDAPNGLHWKIKRLIVPTGFRPLSRTELLDAASPRRTRVDGLSRQVPDAANGPTGPLPLGFIFLPVGLLLVPLALLGRRLGLLRWTVEARAHPWGRRYPPVVLTYLVRGGEETRRVFGELVEALARGEGAPIIAGAEKLGEAPQPHSGATVVGSSGPAQFGKS